MPKKIYNKNAREKALLEEAYVRVYKEEHPAQRAAEEIIGAEAMWDGQQKRGIIDEVDVESGVAIVIDDDGGEHIVELGDFDVVLPVEDAEVDFGYDPHSTRKAPTIELDITKIDDIEFDGIDGRDYPDFVDAFISSADYEEAPGKFRKLTDDEIDWVMDNHGDWFYEKLMDHIY